MPGLETVLYRCDRCKLLFGDSGIPDRCPACLRSVSIAPRIVLAGRDVTEFVIRSTRDELLAGGRKGLGAVSLGICPHGWITSVICEECPI
jgi:hypothetical protein